RQMRTLFDAPVVCSVLAGSQRKTEYQLFLRAVPPEWSQISSIRRMDKTIAVQGDNGPESSLP
ncbi:MAG: hypothetical protein ACRD3Q_10860, partial [Terriglobales bacterium]